MVRRLAAVLLMALFASCGNGKSYPFATGSYPIATNARQWRTTWCDMQPGIVKADLLRRMGPPTAVFADQAQWEGFGVHLTAFFDPDGRAHQLDNNGTPVGCAKTRSVPTP